MYDRSSLLALCTSAVQPSPAVVERMPSAGSFVHAAVYVMAVTVAIVPGVLSNRRHGFDRSVTATRSSSAVTGRRRRKIDDRRHR